MLFGLIETTKEKKEKDKEQETTVKFNKIWRELTFNKSRDLQDFDPNILGKKEKMILNFIKNYSLENSDEERIKDMIKILFEIKENSQIKDYRLPQVYELLEQKLNDFLEKTIRFKENKKINETINILFQDENKVEKVNKNLFSPEVDNFLKADQYSYIENTSDQNVRYLLKIDPEFINNEARKIFNLYFLLKNKPNDRDIWFKFNNEIDKEKIKLKDITDFEKFKNLNLESSAGISSVKFIAINSMKVKALFDLMRQDIEKRIAEENQKKDIYNKQENKAA